MESLSTFEPTKICVEVAPDSQQNLDMRLGQFLSGGLEARRDEIAQVAFPLARAAGLDKVYGINDWTPMRWDGLENHFSRHPEENERFNEWTSRSQKEAAKESLRLAKMPIRDYLRGMNRPSTYRRDAAFSVEI